VQFYNGVCVTKDLVKGYLWAKVAGEQRSRESIRLRSLIGESMTEAQKTEAKALAEKCIQNQYKECG